MNIRYSYRDYWSLLGAPAVVKEFPLNWYSHLLPHIHFNDNQTFIPRGQLGHDRLHKIHPILDKLSQNILFLDNPHQQNSVDEAMIHFQGHSLLKQYMPKSPLNTALKFGADVIVQMVTYALSKYMLEKKVVQSKDWGVG